MYGFSDLMAVKQIGSIVKNTGKYGDIPVWTSGVATAVAPVAAIPTTAAHASLWNGYPSASRKHLVILAVGTIITTSAAAAINLGLAAMLTTVPVTTQTGTAADTIRSLTAPLSNSYGGSASFLSAVTVVANGEWQPVAPTIVCANTANLMLTTEADISGRYIVPPGHQFCLASLCNAAGTAVCKPWVIWAEVEFQS